MEITVYFLNGNGEAAQSAAAARNYRNDVVVGIDDTFYEVHFYVANVLQHEMRTDDFFTIPGLIIVEELTVDIMLNAVEKLADLEYFQLFTGHSSLPQGEGFISYWKDTEGKEFSELDMEIIQIRE